VVTSPTQLLHALLAAAQSPTVPPALQTMLEEPLVSHAMLATTPPTEPLVLHAHQSTPIAIVAITTDNALNVPTHTMLMLTTLAQ